MAESGDPTSAERNGLRSRLPTVSEALQFTPLSSVIPFSPDVIPFPSATSPKSTLLTRHVNEYSEYRSILQSLNQDLLQSNGKSENILRTTSSLRELLHPDDLSQYKFKGPRTSNMNKSSKHRQASLNKEHEINKVPPGKIAEDGLSPFANLMLHSTSVSYRYPTPNSPESKSFIKKEAKSDGHAHGQTSSPSTLVKINERAFQLNNCIPQIAKNESISPVPSKGPIVVVSNLAEPAKRAEYQPVAVSDYQIPNSNQSTPKKRKRESGVQDRIGTGGTDLRERANTEVAQLKNFVETIFEAEDDGRNEQGSENNIFMLEDLSGSQTKVLTPFAQHKLELLIRKISQYSRLSEIGTEQLVRIQGICSRSVSIAENLNLTIGEEWVDEDVRDYFGRIEVADQGLQAAKTILRIMAAALDDKQIYSEEYATVIMKALRNVLESCVIPISEARHGDSGSESLKKLAAEKKSFVSIIAVVNGVLKLVGNFLDTVDVADNLITEGEYICTNLIFVNAAHSERESALSIQKFENIRRTAMDVLSKIFLRYPTQRTFIFDEILSSLAKLPVTPQNARQYRIPDGKPIQLVSALVMRLIQTTTFTANSSKRKPGYSALKLNENESESGSDQDSEDDTPLAQKAKEARPAEGEVLDRLSQRIKPLYDAAQQSAQYVMHYLVQRAITLTKSGDQPYRLLLDIFTEDFISVLGLTEWPSAELLLRTLLSSLLRLAENEKTPAPQKNMALDLLGTMGSGIIDLQNHLRQLAHNIDSSESELAARLHGLTRDASEDDLGEEDILDYDGPYRAVLEYLQKLDSGDAQNTSAQSYHLIQWAVLTCKSLRTRQQHDEEAQNDNAIARLQWLCRQVEQVMDNGDILLYEPMSVATTEAKISSALCMSSSVFCRAQQRIFQVLIAAMTSDQATVKSKGLKSLVQLLEKDPSILDRGTLVISRILSRLADNSPMVRDSALTLVGKCLSLKPTMEAKLCDRIIERAQDSAAGVRKRVLRILKEIYTRNKEDEVRSAIAHAALQRTADDDNGVAEFAKQILEETWIVPFYKLKDGSENYVKIKLALRNQISLIIRTVQRGEEVLNALESFLRAVMSAKSKLHESNARVCKAMVAELFDAVVDNHSFPGEPSQKHILQTLSVFAKVKPDLFLRGQLELLQPYLKDLSSVEDLLIFRAAVVIFRYVLPYMTSLQHDFLASVQGSLVNSLSRLTKMELNEVTQCLWTMDPILKNTGRLARVMISVLGGIHAETKAGQTMDGKSMNKVQRYMSIAGYFGKNCNLDSEAASFRAKFPWWKGSSVSALTIDLILPLADLAYPLPLVESACESVGLVCHAWPQQFLRKDVVRRFDAVFQKQEAKLEYTVLSTILTFFTSEEKRSESGTEIPTGDGVVTGSTRLGSSLVANENDGVSTSIAQTFLRHILRIVLSSIDETALVAAKIIASINRQGLVHPKECGPALVALETSPNATIASIAFTEHRNLHQKHETMFEKEYMKAIDQAFSYQQLVGDDTLGAKPHPFTSKLRPLFEVLKAGNGKVRKKFLANMCSRIDFDVAKVDFVKDKGRHLLFSRFCLQNLAFFEYGRVDEIMHLTAKIDKIINDSGTVIAHLIETEMSQEMPTEDHADSVTNPNDAGADGLANAVNPTETMDMSQNGALDEKKSPKAATNSFLDEARLKHLTTAAMILTMAFETKLYLSRQWGLYKHRESGIGGNKNIGNANNKPSAKDLNKPPSRVHGITGDKYWDRVAEIMTALHTPETMMKQCKAFVEMVSVAQEHHAKLGSGDEGDDADGNGFYNGYGGGNGYETPGEGGDLDRDGQGSAPPSGGSKRGRKRRGSMGLAAGTPKKAMKSKLVLASTMTGGARRGSDTRKSTSSHSPDA